MDPEQAEKYRHIAYNHIRSQKAIIDVLRDRHLYTPKTKTCARIDAQQTWYILDVIEYKMKKTKTGT